MTPAGKSTRAAVAALMPAIALIAGACTHDADESGSASERGNAPPTILSLTEVFRIGDEAAGDSVLLGSVRGMAVDSGERLFVTDSGFEGIRVYSFAGALIGTIGREGEGPGEFARTPSVRVGPGDSLYAWDSYAGQLSVFAPRDHSFVSRLAVGLSETDRLYPGDFLAATSRGFLFHFSSFFTPGSDKPSSDYDRVKLVDWNGTVTEESVASLPTNKGLAIATGNSVSAYGLPYSTGPHFAVGSDERLYYGSDDAIRISRMALRGTDQGEFTVPTEPVRVTGAEREQTITEAPDDFRELLRERLPAVKPAFSRLLPDDTGRLWIELTPGEGEETRTWLVVDDAGTEIARASVPEVVRLRVIRGNRAYGVMIDEATGAPIVAAWDILP